MGKLHQASLRVAKHQQASVRVAKHQQASLCVAKHQQAPLCVGKLFLSLLLSLSLSPPLSLYLSPSTFTPPSSPSFSILLFSLSYSPPLSPSFSLPLCLTLSLSLPLPLPSEAGSGVGREQPVWLQGRVAGGRQGWCLLRRAAGAADEAGLGNGRERGEVPFSAPTQSIGRGCCHVLRSTHSQVCVRLSVCIGLSGCDKDRMRES